MNALEILRDAGLSIRADGDALKVKPSTKITPSLRKLIVTHKMEILASVRRATPAASLRVTELTREQADACHGPSWSDDEIQAFLARRDRLIAWGRSEQEAEVLAERLVLRDREQDDRHLCAECRHGQAQRCPDGQPLPVGVLHRCSRFQEPSL